MRTRPCDKAIRLGRLRKAMQFKKGADLIRDLTEADDVPDTYVALCVLAGTAASDVICCAGLAVEAARRATPRPRVERSG